METAKKYEWCLNSILARQKRISQRSADAFLLGLYERDRKSSYTNQYIFALRHYAKWKNLKLAFRALPRTDDSPFSTLSDDEVHAIITLPETRPQERIQHLMWQLFFSLCALCGLRPKETASIRIDDIDFGRQVINIPKTKTGISRIVPIPPNLIEPLTERMKITACPPLLFHSNQKNQINRTLWGVVFRQWKQRVGISRRGVCVYSFRHTFITRMLEEGVSLPLIQKIVGHKNLESTARYTHLTTKDLVEGIRRHPLVRRYADPRSVLQSIKNSIENYHLENDPRFEYRLTQEDKKLSLVVKLAL